VSKDRGEALIAISSSPSRWLACRGWCTRKLHPSRCSHRRNHHRIDCRLYASASPDFDPDADRIDHLPVARRALPQRPTMVCLARRAPAPKSRFGLTPSAQHSRPHYGGGSIGTILGLSQPSELRRPILGGHEPSLLKSTDVDAATREARTATARHRRHVGWHRHGHAPYWSSRSTLPGTGRRTRNPASTG
jgi:hypothetical protein